MSPGVGVAVFIGLWWLIFFVSLPMGRGKGDGGARLWLLKLVGSAALTALIWVVMDLAVRGRWFSVTSG